MEDKIILTDNGKKVLDYMQKKDEEMGNTFVGKDIGDNLQMKGIYPVLNSLVNRGLVCRKEPVIRDFTNLKGVTQPKEYKTYGLTTAGRNFFVEL